MKVWHDVCCKILVDDKSDSIEDVVIEATNQAIITILENDLDGIEYEGCTIEEVKEVTCVHSETINL